VLRHWSPSRLPGEEGQLRDSALFSVIVAEWPATRAALRRRLAAQAEPDGAGAARPALRYSVPLRSRPR
jgi:hypothetical protein